MIRISRIFTLMFLAFAFSQTQVALADERPNVVIVMTDDQGYGDLSCHGNPILKTPNLDQMYAESVRFTDFHVSPFCTPTRAALMTGNYPGYTGAFRTSSGRTMMHPDEKTIGDLFSSAGYVTGMIGKWHLGDNAPHRPQDRGFQNVLWHRCGGIGQASDHWGNDYFDDTYQRATADNKQGTFEKFEGYCTDVWFGEGVRFIEKNQSKPFLLYLALNAPHGPYRVPPQWAKPYTGNKSVANPNFYGMIANIDHNMGLLRDKLADLGLAENTILIFMTDNGTAAGAKFKGLDSEARVGFNAGMRGKKSSLYDGGHRVPFFVHWPGGKLNQGQDIDTLAAHIDVLPTLADLCGIEVSDEYQPDGVSLKPLLYKAGAAWKRNHLVEQFHGGAYARSFPPKPNEYSVVMTERWRLVNSGQESLFDIEADPAQRTNVANQHPKIVADLRADYDQFWNEVSPRLTPVRIDIGNRAENPTVLCSQDWHMPTGNPPWNFKTIKKLPKVTGPWMLHVQKSGRYRITLRQYPKEADKPVIAESAKIEIGGQTVERLVEPGSHGVEFEIDLPAGPTELVTHLYDKNGKAGGAYFAEVETVEDGDTIPIPNSDVTNGATNGAINGAGGNASRPNIVFLMSDDQRWDTFGCYGRTDVRTPTIDQLSAKGVTFDNAYYAVAICMSSRATMFTGRYFSDHKSGFTYPFNRPLPAKEFADSYPGLLRAAGYRTGFVGKFGVRLEDLPNTVADHFDYFTGISTTSKKGPHFPADDEKLQHIYRKDRNPKERTLIKGDSMIHFLDTQPKGKPFCLSVSFDAVKNDRDGDMYGPHEELFEGQQMWVPENYVAGDNDSLPQVLKDNARGVSLHRKRTSTPEEYQRRTRRFAVQGYTVDQQVKRLMDKLKEMGALENTVVIYTSDNGRFHGSQGLFDKCILYDEAMKQPLIVFDPRAPESRHGSRVDAMVSSTDVAPTILALAGVKPPPSMKGQDLGNLLAGTQDLSQWRDTVLMENFFIQEMFGRNRKKGVSLEDLNEEIITNNRSYRTRGVRTKRYKYFSYYEHDPVIEELYDLEVDPHEQDNLISNPEYTEVLEKLRAKTNELQALATE